MPVRASQDAEEIHSLKGTKGQKPLITKSSREEELKKAYLREFAFLKTQKDGLKKRLDELKNSLMQQKERNAEEVSRLQEKVLKLQRNIDLEQRLIQKLQEQLNMKEEDRDLLDVTRAQALDTLRRHGFYNPRGEDAILPQGVELFREIFDRGLIALGQFSDSHLYEGEFFLKNGEKVQGIIIDVGGIASYGLSERASGVLIPAGEGYMKLWNPNEGTLARNTALYLAGKAPRPETIGVYVYENREKELTPPKTKSIGDIIRAGGIIGYIIIALGLLAAFMMIIRLLRLTLASYRTSGVTRRVLPLVGAMKISEAINLLESRPGVISRVLGSVLKNISQPRETLEYIMAEKLLDESTRLDLFKNPINAIGIVSPLLGLLGTVSGIIKTFDVIVEFGTGSPRLMAGGISEALITTELGLMVAIPTYIFGSLLAGWAENIKSSIQETCLKVINIYKLESKEGS